MFDFTESSSVNVGALREAMKNDCYGAFFGGGYGGAMMESFDIDSASGEELIRKAMDQGINLSEYMN